MNSTPPPAQERKFRIKVLGRTLEHLGVQMYKRRDVAIAELVANAWDAGANEVRLQLPEQAAYQPATSSVVLHDNGRGMEPDEVQDHYLVVGRNRRRDGSEIVAGRPVMGRKGVGKLAGFGLASEMTVITWRQGLSTTFVLRSDELKREDGVVDDVEIRGQLRPVPPGQGSTGTTITLSGLKHVTPIDIEALRESLARRFSRRVKGEMRIVVNGVPLEDPALDLEKRIPETGVIDENIGEGQVVHYHYAFNRTVLQHAEMRGFTVYVRGKTAQAPPFFFGVEGHASGQHGTRYLTGEIEADFLDTGPGDEEDLIATDRQEIDWEAAQTQAFRAWGERLSRKALKEWADRKGKRMEEWILEDRLIQDRIGKLDGSSQNQIRRFLRQLSLVEGETDNARSLADALVQAYEFKHFYDMVSAIEGVADDPEALRSLLTHLRDWEVLESRAVLEIIRGRLAIVEKFHSMIINDAPETAHHRGDDNMHDLIGRYPWLLNPEWQVLAEEKTITKQLHEWHQADETDEELRQRYDFLALGDEGKLIVVEIKRSAHSVILKDLQMLEEYRERLQKGDSRDIHMVMICGGNLSISSQQQEIWVRRRDGEILPWANAHGRAKSHYEHYRALLERNLGDPAFARKEAEIAQTRKVLAVGSAYRDRAERGAGLGPQDANGVDE